MLELEENGLFHNGKLYRVKLQCFVCDAPARQFLKCIAGHCGRGACERCTALYRKYLRYFVFRFTQIYGVNHCIYNLHSLIHLADDCLTHGPLEAFSAFPFETYLGWLTMLVRTPFNPMAQLVNRITEMNQIEDEREEIPNIDSTLSQCSKSNDLLYCNLKVLNQIHFYSCVSWNRERFILLNSKWNGS